MTSPAIRCPDGTQTPSRDRLPGVVDLMDVRHLAVKDAIAPTAVTADNVGRFRRLELRSLHGGEPFSQQGYPRVSRASMIALYHSRQVRTLRAPADSERHK